MTAFRIVPIEPTLKNKTKRGGVRIKKPNDGKVDDHQSTNSVVRILIYLSKLFCHYEPRNYYCARICMQLRIVDSIGRLLFCVEIDQAAHGSAAGRTEGRSCVGAHAAVIGRTIYSMKRVPPPS